MAETVADGLTVELEVEETEADDVASVLLVDEVVILASVVDVDEEECLVEDGLLPVASVVVTTSEE